MFYDIWLIHLFRIIILLDYRLLSYCYVRRSVVVSLYLGSCDVAVSGRAELIIEMWCSREAVLHVHQGQLVFLLPDFLRIHVRRAQPRSLQGPLLVTQAQHGVWCSRSCSRSRSRSSRSRSGRERGAWLSPVAGAADSPYSFTDNTTTTRSLATLFRYSM